MADFHIKGHIKRAGPLRFIAIVCVMPAGNEDNKYVESAEKVASTHLAAVECLRAMAITMGEKLRNEGHEVLTVRLIEADFGS